MFHDSDSATVNDVHPDRFEWVSSNAQILKFSVQSKHVRKVLDIVVLQIQMVQLCKIEGKSSR